MSELTTKADKVRWIVGELERLYPETPVPLDHTDPYTLLVAVLLSAQCTDERVNKVTPALFALADNPRDMMVQEVADIKAIIRPCGLSPRKSAAISELSRILVEEHDGEVPADFDALEALPGVGHKTAGVVMSQAFGIPSVSRRHPHPPLDAPMEPVQREIGGANGARRQAVVSRRNGTNFTCKSFSTAGSTALPEDGILRPTTSPRGSDAEAFGKG